MTLALWHCSALANTPGDLPGVQPRSPARGREAPREGIQARFAYRKAVRASSIPLPCSRAAHGSRGSARLRGRGSGACPAPLSSQFPSCKNNPGGKAGHLAYFPGRKPPGRRVLLYTWKFAALSAICFYLIAEVSGGGKFFFPCAC